MVMVMAGFRVGFRVRVRVLSPLRNDRRTLATEAEQPGLGLGPGFSG